MAQVSYDDRSFLVDGRRIWLVSGEIHYFRIPAPLWRDRLLKAKRGGLNCIATPLAWSLHEPAEGKWDFKGDLDVVAFVKMAQELGLYVILRAGPYVGADLGLGGLPPWLLAKSGMSLRSPSASFTHYFDRFYRQILPRLAECQVPRGGNIIAVQNEHDYTSGTMPDRINYLQFVSQLIRRAGFETPILTANALSNPPLGEAVECVTTDANEVQQFKRLRLAHPLEPAIDIEFNTGATGYWGQNCPTPDADTAARRAMEIVGCGGQINQYLFCGGTNLGFLAGRGPQGRFAFTTTSYDRGSPVSESGELTEKYYRLRLVNMLANHMGFSLANCCLDEPGVTIHDSTGVLNIAGPYGHWAVVTSGGRKDIASAEISLPTGETLRVPLAPLGACAVPVDIKLSASHTLDWANLTPLGFLANKVLLLHGPADWQATLSINGKAVEARLPAQDAPLLIDHQGLLVVLLSSDLAQRTWITDEAVVMGPLFVGETVDDVLLSPRIKQYSLLSLEDFKLKVKKSANGTAKHASSASTPKLSAWKRQCVCTEPVAQDLEWTPMRHCSDADHLGQHEGYIWYRAQVDSPRARKLALLPTGAADRATFYVNGSLAGVWGVGPDATLDPLKVSLRSGANSIVMLLDDLGRFHGGSRMGQPKGLWAPIYAAEPLKLRKIKLATSNTISRRLIPRHQSHLADMLDALPLQTASWSIPLKSITPIHVAFDDVPCHVGIVCNNRLAGLFINEGENFGEVTLRAELTKGKNELSLLLWGACQESVLDKFRFHNLTEDLSEQAAWSHRPWQLCATEGPVVGKDQPAWYAASFAGIRDNLYLHVIGAKKGQLLLNGHNIGRFWTAGPQQDYYLPPCWLKEHNELLMFEEQGNAPSGARLVVKA